jgi:pSer/pThr/pTyr-binding forkhead associated (FHA) protein/tetratricopeptide (TPR) repeat protein
MSENRNSKSKLGPAPDAPRGGSSGRRPGRHTTHQAEALTQDNLPPIEPQDLMDPESTGGSVMGEVDGFYQATAMLDKGELLGELAEIANLVPDTRAAVEAEAPPKGCRLIVVSGPNIGMEWGFKQPELVMGRDEECELVLSDIGVSRRHAKIALERDRFFLQDLGSGNGTFLNGVRIEREPLASGDEIVIGERTLRFVELNEAPPTAAAHPIGEKVVSEPAVGSVSKVPAAKDQGLGKASQVDVGVVPKVDGPEGASELKPALEQQEAAPGPKQGAALRRVAGFVVAIVLLAAIGAGSYFGYRYHRQKRSSENRIQTSHREFLEGVELVKQLRFGDATIMFDRVLAVRPDYARAKEYREHCERELRVWEKMENAKQLAAAHHYTEAVAVLEALKEDTAYLPEIERLKKEYWRAISEAMLEEARAKMAAGDFDGALELVESAVQLTPSLAALAQKLREEIEKAREEANKPEAKPKEEIPPELLRAVALYKNDNIAAAIDAAEAVGGPNAPIWIARMKQVKKLMVEAAEAHRKKGAGDLLRIAPHALGIDWHISLGEGKVRAKLKTYYADALYLKAIDAYQDRDFIRTYQLLNDALKQKPDHRLSGNKLADLSRKAHDLYYEGFGIKDTNTDEARRIFKKLVQITAPDNLYHKNAQKWLAEHGG